MKLGNDFGFMLLSFKEVRTDLYTINMVILIRRTAISKKRSFFSIHYETSVYM